MIRRLRDLVFHLYLAVSLAVLGIMCLPLAFLGENAARLPPKLWTRGALGALGLITGVRYRVEGSENIPRGGALVAANHQSIWETLALYVLLPRPVVILKQELSAIPVYGFWARASGNIIVDRKGGAKALRAMQREASRRLDEGCQVVIFPEGTRAAPGEILRLKPGAAAIYLAASAPCVPVAHDSGRFWRHPGMEKQPGEITLRFDAPIPPGLDRKAFLSRLEERLMRLRPDLEPASANEGAPVTGSRAHG